MKQKTEKDKVTSRFIAGGAGCPLRKFAACAGERCMFDVEIDCKTGARMCAILMNALENHMNNMALLSDKLSRLDAEDSELALKARLLGESLVEGVARLEGLYAHPKVAPRAREAIEQSLRLLDKEMSELHDRGLLD